MSSGVLHHTLLLLFSQPVLCSLTEAPQMPCELKTAQTQPLTSTTLTQPQVDPRQPPLHLTWAKTQQSNPPLTILLRKRALASKTTSP